MGVNLRGGGFSWYHRYSTVNIFTTTSWNLTTLIYLLTTKLPWHCCCWFSGHVPTSNLNRLPGCRFCPAQRDLNFRRVYPPHHGYKRSRNCPVWLTDKTYMSLSVGIRQNLWGNLSSSILGLLQFLWQIWLQHGHLTWDIYGRDTVFFRNNIICVIHDHHIWTEPRVLK